MALGGSPRGHRPPNAPAVRNYLCRTPIATGHLGLRGLIIAHMRGLLFVAAALVAAALLDFTLYDGRYLNAAAG